MSKRWIWIPGLTLLAVIGAGLFAGREPILYARIAAHYAAKQTCSCVFVSERTLESCRGDFPNGAGDAIALRQTDNGIVASIAGGVISARADHEPNYGCRIVR